MQTDNRPMSPHIQIYKPQLTSVMSILHRITGIALAPGVLLLIYWLVAAASGPQAFARAQSILGSFPGQTVLFGFTLAMSYHLFNGLRHLVWDAGMGMDLRSTYISGYLVMAATVVLTLLIWIVAYTVGGA